MTKNFQRLTINTISSSVEIKAPSGWYFDNTAQFIWYKLVLEKDRLKNISSKSIVKKFELLRCQHRIDLLCELLSNTHGMAPPYWKNWEASED